MKRILLLATYLWCLCIASMAAQSVKCTGTVIDEQKEPVIGATVTVPGTNIATATNFDGKFTINVPQKAKEIKISSIGYKPVSVAPKASLGVIEMVPEAIMLADVVVTQSVGKTRETPVAMSSVDAVEIEAKIGAQELMEVLKTTPGVYTIREGGGFGDAETRMRGFKSANVAMMVNGIPINDMEWGGVYQSNWAGLGDVASSIQTQRGLGATIVSTPSIGGTINITTRTIDVDRGGSLWYGMGNDGMNLYGFKLSTGLMKNGWAVTVLGSRKWGDGYVQGTDYNSYNYFINVSKRINERHQIGLTAFGAPQEHNQRSPQDGLTVEGWQNVRNYMNGESPYRYNPTFGYDRHGQVRNSNRNVYHKPQIAFNHIWKIDDSSSLSSSFYFSVSSGYGMKGLGRTATYANAWYGSSNGVLNTTYRCADGTFNYAAIQEMNEKSTTGSNMILAKNMNSHEWYGLVSSYKKQFDFKNGDRINLIAGLDMRYYIGHHKAEIADLFDGEYYMDNLYRSTVKASNNSAAANSDWAYEKLSVGDVVYRNFDSFVVQEGVYAQGEYTLLDKRLNLVLSGALNNNTYWRKDFFYYDAEHARSATKSFIGGTIKGGANYNFDRHNNVFVNAGYISRAPFYSYGVFLNAQNSNETNPNSRNEKVASFEVGYGYHSPTVAVTVNGYWTKWMDRTMVKTDEIRTGVNAGQRWSCSMSGVDARHMGVEVNVKWIPTRWLELDGMISMGDWIWDSNATGYFYNQQGQPLANLSTGEVASGILAPDHVWATLNQKGVKVGGSAQTTGALGATFRPFQGMRVGLDWTWCARNYSDINITGSSLSGEEVVETGEPWRIPWGNQLDLNVSYRFKIGGLNATIYGNVHNLCNYNYVTQAYTPASVQGDWENAYRVFYNFGRTYSCKLKINF